MKLKALELFGFKSFVDKTVVHFEDKITGIVGPNGCGKSNIVDAMRWAMGEQSAKHLRGAEMQDVIFNGTQSRSSIGMAQVVLKFDTSDGRTPAGFADYPEIQVERKLYRSGESEYYINKIPCRLKDIIDLFLGTGVGTKAYSIIEQGKVEQIILSKPEDRRQIIEEAAGISKFKNRKEIALRKMEATQGNLARLEDVINEIKRQLASLERQAKKAERHRKLFEELKEKELRVSTFQYQKLKTEIEKFESESSHLNEDEAASASKISEVELRVEKEKLETGELEQELNLLQEQYYVCQNAIKLHEANLEHQASKLKDLARLSDTYTHEIAEFRGKIAKAVFEIEKINETKEGCDLKWAKAQESILELENVLAVKLNAFSACQEGAEKLNEEMLRTVGTVAQSQSRLEYLDRREVDINGQVARAQAEIDAIDHVLKELRAKINTNDKKMEDLKEINFQMEGESGQVKTELVLKQNEFEIAAQNLENFKDALTLKESRLKSLQEVQQNLDGYSDGVKVVLQASRDGHLGVRGAVSELIDAPKEFEPAVHAVLGEKLQYVVVASQAEGVSALEYLRTQSKGRSTFVPLNIRLEDEGDLSVQQDDGVVGPLIDKIHFHDDYKAIAQYLFGDCLLVQDLKRALHIWQNGGVDKTLVTLQGDVIDPAGVISGGGSLESESLLSHKRRVKELHGEVAVSKVDFLEMQKEVDRLKAHIKGLQGRHETLERDTFSEEIRRVKQERDVLRLQEEERRYSQDRDRLSLEIARHVDEQNELKKEKQEVASLLDKSTARQESLEKELAQAQISLSQGSLEKEGLTQELTKARTLFEQAQERVALAQKDLQHWVQTKSDLENSVEKRLSEINLGQIQMGELRQGQETERKGLEESLQKIEDLKTRQNSLQEEYNLLTKQIQEKEMTLRDLRRRFQEITKIKHASDLQLQESRNQLKILIDQMMERYKIEIGVHVAGQPSDTQQAPETVLLEQEMAVILELRDRLDKLGSVHVGAIEEYDSLNERYQFLSKQRDDLVHSLESLQKAITKINRVSRERFIRTFELVNQKFQEIFPRLFKGGKARLVLLDEHNLLDSGVEIVAQPPGKKLQSISLLSGGEKALTAVALIFSIFLIKPSPFCLLDEVDAPLDDANIDRFNDMIRDMTSHSQFIVITHNKRTMEQTDCLYGITMEEAGVSKVVSVRLKGSQDLAEQVA